MANREEMTGFFNKSLTGIRTLVGDQSKEVKEATGRLPKVRPRKAFVKAKLTRRVKKILLVGGLGSSEYVYDVLTEIFSNRVLRPSDG
jgi:hypothetical protein